MVDHWSAEEIGRRIRAVESAETPNFRRLIELGGLNPQNDLRFQNWAGVSFAGQDIRGIDFTGASLVHCDFRGAFVEGARFDRAVLDWGDRYSPTDISKAWDWRRFELEWRPSSRRSSDGHLRPGMMFHDSALAPKMVVVPVGETSGEDRALSIQGVNDTSGAQLMRNAIETAFAVSDDPITDSQFSAYRSLSARRTGKVMRATKAEAVAYVNWLRQVTGFAYRLLDRYEWEYWCGRSFGRNESGNSRTPSTPQRRSLFGVVSEFPPATEWCTDVEGDASGSVDEQLDGLPVASCSAVSSSDLRRSDSTKRPGFGKYAFNQAAERAGFRVARPLLG